MAVSSVTINNPADPQSISTEIVRPQIVATYVGGTPNYDVLWEWDDDFTFADGNGRRVQENDVGLTTAGTKNKVPTSDLDVADGRTFFTRVTVTDNSGGGSPVASGIHDLDYTDPNPSSRNHLYIQANVGVAFDPKDAKFETQRVSHDGTGGTFLLDLDGQETGTIDWNENGADLKTELELLSNVTTVDVVKISDGDWIVTFVDVSPSPIPAMTADDTALTGDTEGVVITVYVDDATPWGTGGTVGADGDNNPSTRNHLFTDANVGVGFDPTDGTLWNTDPPDGFTIDFQRYIFLDANLTTDQPCPFLFSLSQAQVKVGDSITVKGQGLVSASSPTADAWDAEVRLYETPSFAAAFVSLAITTWTAGSVEDEIVATVPGGATSGFIAVVHTTTPTCSGSNFIGLTVIAKDPDRQAGWWAEVWDLRNVTKIISPIPLVAEVNFETVANDIGSGAIFLRGDDEDIDDIVDRSTNPEIQRLVKFYLHDRFAYGIIPDDSEEEYDDDGARTVRMFGAGQERILRWGACLWKDFPAQPSKNRTWQYGSTENSVPWGDMEPKNQLTNGDIEDAQADPWVAVGTAGLFASSAEANSGIYSLRVTPAALDDGVEITFSQNEGDGVFADLFTKVATVGGTYEIEVLGKDEDDNDVVHDSFTWVPAGTSFVATGLDYVAAAGEQVRLRITQTAGTLIKFFVDDATAHTEIDGTILAFHATARLSRTEVAAGQYSLRVDAEAGGDAAFNGVEGFFAENANQQYRLSVAVSGVAGKTVQFDVRLGGVLLTGVQVLTGSPTFDVITLEGTSGPTAGTGRFTVRSKESATLTYFVDEIKILVGAASANPGTIVTDVHTAMAARATLDFIGLNFDGSLDTAGLPWPEELPFEVDPQWSLWDLLEKFVGLGYSVELSPVNWREGGDTGWELNMWAPLNAGVNWPDFDDGPAILPSDTIRDVEPSSAPPPETVVYGEGSGGIWTVATASAGRISNLERREAFVKADHAKDTVTLFRVISHRLDTSLQRGTQWTAKLTDDADPLPYFDFINHDRLRAHLPTDGSRDLVFDDTYLVAATVFRGTAGGVNQEYEIDFGRYKIHAQRIRDLILARQVARESSENYGPGTGSVSSRSSSAVGASSVSAQTQGEVVAHPHVWSDIGPPLTGDLGGSFPNASVLGLRGRLMASSVPTLDQGLFFKPGTGLWTPSSGAGSWQTPTLGSSWVPFSGDYDTLQYRRDHVGIVHLRGLIKDGTVTAGTVLFTLPTGFRPGENHIFPATTSIDAFTPISIRSSGDVELRAGVNNTFLSLAGISFDAADGS